jgi:REP element-mobilizing transposase RayT
MTRQRRNGLPAGGFHVTSRGVLRQTIYFDPHDYARFERDLHRISHELEWELAAYVLMPNHFHALVETDPERLSAGMQRLKLRHAIRLNRRRDSVGHAFERRFWCEAIEDERHLCEVARYIVLNPVRANLCSHPGYWRWSSYNATAGGAESANGRGRLLDVFGGNPASYRAFVAEGIAG